MALFTLQKAREVLPEVQNLTGQAVQKIQELARAANSRPSGDPERDRLAAEAQSIVQRWAEEIAELGAEAKGLWLVDFDNGEGYYCWKFPEETLEFFHSYDDGFKGRTLIEPEILH